MVVDMSILKASQTGHSTHSHKELRDESTERDTDHTHNLHTKTTQSAHISMDCIYSQSPQDVHLKGVSKSHFQTKSQVEELQDPTHSHDLMWIHLEDIRVEVIIGIHPLERTTTQPLVINLEMGLDKSSWIKSATFGALSASVDYAQVARQVQEVAEYGCFRLLESLAYLITYMILRTPERCEQRTPLKAARFTIRKPKALSDQSTPTPAISGEVWHHDIIPARQNSAVDLSHFIRLHPNNETLTVTPILQLEEASIFHVSASQASSINLRQNERLVRLGGAFTVQDDKVSWSEAISMLLIIQHEYTSVASSKKLEATR